jgi:uncharacterized protein with ATP-grasp and redox domains
MADCTTEEQKEILDQVALQIPDFSLNNTPPEMAGVIQKLVKEKTNNDDPYLELKEHSSLEVKKQLPEISKIINDAEDSFFTALKLAIAGNIIDYGANNNLDIKSELFHILENFDKKLEHESKDLFNYDAFLERLASSNTLLYIGDNVGEHFFDKLFIEQIKLKFPTIQIKYAYRDVPILNDINRKDVIEAEIDKVAEIMSSGSQLPGTLLKKCSEKFLNEFKNADIIIAKGQGNYETLSEADGPVFFLLMAKCQIIANHANCKLKDLLLIKNFD